MYLIKHGLGRGNGRVYNIFVAIATMTFQNGGYFPFKVI
jgi:hypothetical protein